MIKLYENTIKDLITDILGSADDSDYKIPKDRLEKWIDQRKLKKKKNNGFLFEKRIVFYADFEDLKLIIDQNWSQFEPVLGNKNRFLVFFDEVFHFQNILNQGKPLIKSQLELLSGIVTDLKNAITIYKNKKSVVNDYFIAIHKVSDNVGSSWSIGAEPNKTPILKVNDEYELLIEANDPKDRDIEYELFHFTGSLRIKQTSNRFNFTIDKKLIGQKTILIVKAFTPKSSYINESSMKIQLTVLP